MNKKNVVVSTLLAAMLAAGSSMALAQPRPDDHRDEHRDKRGHGPRGDHRPPGHDRDARPDPSPARWGRGDRVPEAYRGRQYVVDDWRGHHLRQPPRGYHWISTGPDYFLIGVATGAVLESVLNH